MPKTFYCGDGRSARGEEAMCRSGAVVIHRGGLRTAVVRIWGGTTGGVVAAKTCSGAWASDVSPRNIASTACMLSPSMPRLKTAAPLTFRSTASIWYVVMVPGSSRAARRRTPAARPPMLSVTTSRPSPCSIRPAGDARVEQALGQQLDSVRAGSPVGGRCGRSPTSRLLRFAAARRVLVLVLPRASLPGRGRRRRAAAGRLPPSPNRVAGRVVNGTATPRRSRRAS